MTGELLLSIRDVSPAPQAVRLTGVRPDGAPEGFHTGGAWLLGDEVWKPADGRPFANAPYHWPTEEIQALTELKDCDLCPPCWRVEERNGRTFIVRPKAGILGVDVPWYYLDGPKLDRIEAGVREINHAHWAINDEIQIGVLPAKWHYRMFVVDLSVANKSNRADDSDYLIRWLKYANPDRHHIRKAARRTLYDYTLRDLSDDEFERRTKCQHAYGSFSRPLDRMWAQLPDDCVLVNDTAVREEGRPYTWVLSPTPLDPYLCRTLELTWGWSPHT